jgi:hypothetical protein
VDLAYNIGDTVLNLLQTISNIVSGRIKHYISGFGEHVTNEVESALQEAMVGTEIRLTNPLQLRHKSTNLVSSYHEWFIEFENEPQDSKTLCGSDRQCKCKQHIL